MRCLVGTSETYIASAHGNNAQFDVGDYCAIAPSQENLKAAMFLVLRITHVLLGGSCDLVSVYAWAYHLVYIWGNLHKAIEGLQDVLYAQL